MSPAPRRRLPPGRHGIPSEVVRDHQRRRLIAAMAECCARDGYAATSVNDVARQASVSKRSFYQIFRSKEECLLLAYETYRDGLLDSIDSACGAGGDWSERARIAVRGALSFLAADPAGAELLVTTVLCAGSSGARRHYETIDAIAERLRDSAPRIAGDHPRADWSAAASIGAMVGQAANTGGSAEILALEDDLSAALLALTAE